VLGCTIHRRWSKQLSATYYATYGGGSKRGVFDDAAAGTGSVKIIPYTVQWPLSPGNLKGSWKTAWNLARKRAAVVLAGNPEDAEDIPSLGCRFHDPRPPQSAG
jgi:hypothetical protein